MIKKRKKNPHTDRTYLDSLKDAFIHGTVHSFVNALIFYKIGELCNDCNGYYHECDCEYCDDCLQNCCICKYDLASNKIYGYDKDKLRKIVWKLLRESYLDEELNILLHYLWFKTNSNFRFKYDYIDRSIYLTGVWILYDNYTKKKIDWKELIKQIDKL